MQQVRLTCTRVIIAVTLEKVILHTYELHWVRASGTGRLGIYARGANVREYDKNGLSLAQRTSIPPTMRGT